MCYCVQQNDLGCIFFSFSSRSRSHPLSFCYLDFSFTLTRMHSRCNVVDSCICGHPLPRRCIGVAVFLLFFSLFSYLRYVLLLLLSRKLLCSCPPPSSPPPSCRSLALSEILRST
ncbi:conserved hypothetical protein, unlikely [Trypanosoma brucei gambiense DAL972]|uniref:Uncharacterized protein n=1 Tax=Trypanosoma brucei gambiense (strain MHOM/CI/86/DAL972) TaxID=679716 RepID=C9ZZ38_TRYB9|nr:conserved hypothetical protein, unlikely [Trypanosoma brucei gambiense DAL972]CBH14687.1 conserved hypothetical protein, unlikely [Trypanosoma brucei gambiense DAL972]|eukprot:XP_011776953.1 conserved hypothetical protein, unlikely [Trypanosoma brucei gambiense DAL972]